jgi:hypothetical protein
VRGAGARRRFVPEQQKTSSAIRCPAIAHADQKLPRTRGADDRADQDWPAVRPPCPNICVAPDQWRRANAGSLVTT